MPPVFSDNPPVLESRVRFTVRGMLIGTTVVAACLAIAGPWFRQWAPEQRAAVLLTWSKFAIVVSTTIAIACLIRLRAEKRAGPARYRLPLSTTKFAKSSAVFMAFFSSSGVVLSSFPMASAVDAGWMFRALFDFLLLQSGVVVAFAVLGVWWGTHCVELCDAGVLCHGQFVSWETLRGFRWGGVNPNLLMLQHGWGVITARPRTEDKATIEKFLADRVRT